jgi:hypothetical protein
MRLGLASLGIAAVLVMSGEAFAQSDDAQAMVGAALNDRPDRIAELVASGVPVDASFMGMTALCMVAGYDDSQHLESAKALLKAGADVNRHCGPAQRTPLHDAALDGDVELARLLLANGADRNARTKFGRTPLDFATSPPAPLKPPANSAAMALLLQGGPERASAKVGEAPSTKTDPPTNKVANEILAAKQKAYEAGRARMAEASAPSVVSYAPDFPAVEPVPTPTGSVPLRLLAGALLLLGTAIAAYWFGRRRGAIMAAAAGGRKEQANL